MYFIVSGCCLLMAPMQVTLIAAGVVFAACSVFIFYREFVAKRRKEETVVPLDPEVIHELSSEARRFLYACAFWLTSADESLRRTEQEWLDKQFGRELSKKLLKEFLAMEEKAFYKEFDKCAARLTKLEKKRLYPVLESWLGSAAFSDNEFSTIERAVLDRIMHHLKISKELKGN